MLISSSAKPIAFERVFLSLTSVPVSNCKTHNLFYNIQKMNCLLPSIWSFTQAFFFVPVAAESLTEWRVGSVETRLETEYLFTNIDPKKNWTNIVPRAGILKFHYSKAMWGAKSGPMTHASSVNWKYQWAPLDDNFCRLV